MKKILLTLIVLIVPIIYATNSYGSGNTSYNIFKFYPAKIASTCPSTKLEKITSTLSFCYDHDAEITATSMGIINCSNAVYYIANNTNPLCSTGMSGYTKIGDIGSVYIRVHGSLDVSGYDIFVIGPQKTLYMEMDNLDASTWTIAQKAAYLKLKASSSLTVRDCLLNLRKTSDAKCIITSTVTTGDPTQ
ncbi:MAG: hypothetical protein NTY22_03790 [Proteobacteria bacterium]|nr:hypothetical protein [Pseudomonadota bacterium]